MSISNLSMNVSSMGNYIPSSSGSDSSLKSLEKKLQQLETEKQKAIQSKDKENCGTFKTWNITWLFKK